uniref:Uncharacterized protein n=1 Tax=Anguilla anguilla TaxID=7936 RepID=A0A0E9R1J8_ANGAN
MSNVGITTIVIHSFISTPRCCGRQLK